MTFSQFLRERQPVGAIVLALQGLESRMLSVLFSPHHIGAAAGKIIFRHYEPKREESEPGSSKVVNKRIVCWNSHKLINI